MCEHANALLTATPPSGSRRRRIWELAHHDGGLEDRHSVLDASLAAADLVICQTGCISHNAYWKVKDFCKRTGKRCVFVENPSTSSLARAGAGSDAGYARGLIGFFAYSPRGICAGSS